MGRLPQPEKRDDDGETNGNFRRRHGDDEEHEDLRIVIGCAGCIDMEPRKRDK